jgi:hypothetical protein
LRVPVFGQATEDGQKTDRRQTVDVQDFGKLLFFVASSWNPLLKSYILCNGQVFCMTKLTLHKSKEGVTFSQMRFGKSALREKKKGKVGRSEKYLGDPKQKTCVSIRKSYINRKPENLNITDFVEGCIESSMLVP